MIRPATPDEIEEASYHIGACQEIPVDLDALVYNDDLDITCVSHWSIKAEDRESGDLWCKPGCSDGAHVCPDEPTICDDPDEWIDGGEGVKIAHYAYQMRCGDAFLPIVVIERLDGTYAVEDGYHRISAHLMLGQEKIPTLVMPEVD